MSNPSTSTGGLQRSALRNATANVPRASEPLLPASAPRHAPPPQESSDFAYFLKALAWMSVGAAGLLALLYAGQLMRDNMAAGNAVSEAKRQRGALICQDGHMRRGDGSLHDRLFEDAVFVCDDWRTLDAVKEEEMKLANPPKMQGTQLN